MGQLIVPTKPTPREILGLGLGLGLLLGLLLGYRFAR